MPNASNGFLAQLGPQPRGDGAELLVRDDAAVARARPAGRDDVDEAAGPRRHDADPVGQHRRLVERMGDEHDGRAGLAPDAQQLVAHQQPRLLVERAERLVEQQHLRLEHQRARDADALAHAAGKLRRIGLGEVRKPHEGERVVDAPLDLGARHAAPAQAEGDVVPNVEPEEARVLLEHGADAVGDRASERLAVERRTCRRSAADRPASTSSSVDLPQPEGPTTEKNSPRAISEIDRAERMHVRMPARGPGNTLVTPRRLMWPSDCQPCAAPAAR